MSWMVRTTVLLIFLTACHGETNKKVEISPRQGLWRGLIKMQGQEMPFNFEFSLQEGQPLMYLINGEERIMVDDISVRNDSLVMPMHIFDASIVAALTEKKMKIITKLVFLCGVS